MAQPPSPLPLDARLTDSPWLWLTLFSAAGLVVLLAMSPRYGQRQRRLEMQYRARQEVSRRQEAGESPTREPGQEGSEAPPPADELIIPLWPIVALDAVALVFSTIQLWRARRRTVATLTRAGGPDP